MKRPQLLFLFLFVFIISSFPQCYELIWSEEFDSAGLPDPAIWNLETGAGGWGNNELQYYRADTSNVRVENGLLTIMAKKENYGGAGYTSTRLNTRGRFEVKYGKVEALIRLPYGQGIWPAFWMLGENFSEVGWPACGEIDIMEMVGGEVGDHTIHGTVHWDHNGSHAQYGNGISLDSGRFADDFHLFSVEWTPQTIRWYMDSIQYNVIDITPSGLDEFRNEFFIVLNLAVGGNWPGNPDASTEFPQRMEVDYIRVYKTGDMLGIRGESGVVQKQAHLKYSLPCSPLLIYQWDVPEDAVIESGQGTDEITVNWGCQAGDVTCMVTGSCGTHYISMPVTITTDHPILGPMFINPGAGDQFFFTRKMVETTYEWSVPADATILEGEGTDSIRVSWGSAYTGVSVITTNSCGSDTVYYRVYPPGQYPFPDPGIPHSIPGVINAVDYDYGGEGVAYHDLTAANEGPGPRQDERVDTENRDNGTRNVGWISSGEWLEYTIAVHSAGLYDLSMRVATDNASGGPFAILVNGEERLGGISVNNTGGWGNFVTLRPGSLSLDVTDTLMRLDFSSGGFNLGDMTFQYNSSGATPQEGTGSGFRIYPNPAGQQLLISGGLPAFTWQIVNLNGSVVMDGVSDRAWLEVDIGGLHAGSYLVVIRTMAGEGVTRRLIKLPA